MDKGIWMVQWESGKALIWGTNEEAHKLAVQVGGDVSLWSWMKDDHGHDLSRILVIKMWRIFSGKELKDAKEDVDKLFNTTELGVILEKLEEMMKKDGA
jgi:ribosomal protein L7/L12